MKITVFGSGYVGLVTSACLAELGNQVQCVDINQERITRLQGGDCPIHEPGLTTLMRSNMQAGRLSFTTDAEMAVKHGFYIFITVGTPASPDGSADLQYVMDVAETVGQYMDEYRLVISKSTVPVGTSAQVRGVILNALDRRTKSVNFEVASNPEFLREGSAIDDFMQCDRIIIGADTPEATRHLQRLYAPLNRHHDRVIVMDVCSAELTKYAANAMLATKISFMNEMSNLAERVGADIENIRRGIGSDSRIGYQFMNAGCGYGGSCFPKDLRALEYTAKEQGYDACLIRAISKVNQYQKGVLARKILRHFNQDITGKVIALWGLAFKPNTDDMREASSRALMETLWEQGVIVQAYDPAAMNEAKRIYGEREDLIFCDDPYLALQGADALAIVTEWSVFASPDFHAIKASLSEAVIFDGRNLYEPDDLEKLGISYYAIGRGRQGCPIKKTVC